MTEDDVVPPTEGTSVVVTRRPASSRPPTPADSGLDTEPDSSDGLEDAPSGDNSGGNDGGRDDDVIGYSVEVDRTGVPIGTPEPVRRSAPSFAELYEGTPPASPDDHA